jgi:hypothetical protein
MVAVGVGEGGIGVPVDVLVGDGMDVKVAVGLVNWEQFASSKPKSRTELI